MVFPSGESFATKLEGQVQPYGEQGLMESGSERTRGKSCEYARPVT
jgi:hypothetical protein